MSNRRRNEESVKVSSIAIWLIVALFVGVVGLRYVYLTNQIHTTGRQIHELEVALKEINAQNDVARAKISQLSSRTALQRKLAEGFIKMQPITDDRIVRIAAKPGVVDQVRAVANRGDAQ